MSQHSNLSLFALCVSLIDLIKIWCSRSRQDLNLLKERLRVRHLPSERGTLPAHKRSRQRCSLCDSDSDSEHLTAAHPKACLQTGEMADCSVIVHSEMKMSPHPTPSPPTVFPIHLTGLQRLFSLKLHYSVALLTYSGYLTRPGRKQRTGSGFCPCFSWIGS